MKTFLKWFAFIIALLVIIYLLGPKPATPKYSLALPLLPSTTGQLEAYVIANESSHRIKPDNEARIIWVNDVIKQKTKYSIVYLHGFTASQAEGEPLHRNLAKAFGCNLYLSRLAEHGIDTIDPMRNLTATKYWESAKQAFAVGKQIGHKVILVGTSTGGTNALQLAAAYPDDVAALILLSPNVAINNPKAQMLNNPWGLQMARLVNGKNAITAKDSRTIYKKYWYHKYRLEPTTELQELLETTMTKETFEKVRQPALLLYYYRDRVHQDSVVSVRAMLQMFDQLFTPADRKFKKAMPNTGNHVIGSYIKSHDLEGVQREIENFLINVLQMKKSIQ